MPVNTIRNPYALTDLWEGREIGDPFLMRHDGRFYLYCSSHSNRPGIKCWVSDDMLHFDYQGFVCTDERTIGAYAPEVAYNVGKFWMVTSPRGSGHYLLCADSPLGPFQVVSDNLGIGIDGSIFVDDDGRSYFYRASHQGIRVHQMPTPGEIDVRSKVIEASWLGHWTEGPQIIKRDGRYFLTDTGNHVLSRGYHVDYVVSHEGPDCGFRKLRDGILLLETRDEYHALGHSSTCVGPDMDTMYIIYHKNILNERNHPLHRSMNIDRLYFNGDRMYCNATWWHQPAPKQPVCVSRNGEGLVNGALPVEAGETFTAEINVRMTAEACSVNFAGAVLTMHNDRRWQLSTGESGVFPANVAMDALMTVKVSLRQGLLVLCINGMEFLRKQTELTGGKIGVGEGCQPSFVGLSDVAQGSEDCAWVKSVPGAFDAVHCIGGPANTGTGETNCAALVMKPGDQASFAVNVWQTRKYYLAATVLTNEADMTICVNGQRMTAGTTGVSTCDNMEKRYFGTVELPAGQSMLEICAETDATIDRIFLTEADPFAPAVIIEDGEDVTEGALQVVGHKAQGSMHRKFCGFTAAEGYGEAWYGQEWRDYELRMTINMKPCSPDATASAYIRSSRESWHGDQVKASRRAYALHVQENRIVLAKQCYKDIVTKEVPISVEWGSELTLIFRAKGSKISVIGDNGVLLEMIDPMPWISGRVGISAVTDGLGFEKLSVHPVE